MTREILNQIAKEHKINLDWYDKVNAFINEAYTKIFITFYTTENLGGRQHLIAGRTITKNVYAIERKSLTQGTPGAWEYTTDDIEYINAIQ